MSQKVLQFVVVVLCLCVAGLVFDRVRPDAEVTARKFVVVDERGRRVALFGVHDERPGEVVLLLRAGPQHFVAASAGRGMAGMLFKAADEERAISTGSFAERARLRPVAAP